MLWTILISLFCTYLLLNFVSLRLLVTNPFYSGFFSVKDLVNYIKHKDYNRCPDGEMTCYAAHFGRGKTLSAVHKISSLYKKYNNKMVYDRSRRKMVMQKIHVISNVKFNNIPSYQPLEGLQQIVENAYMNRSVDEKNDTLTVILVLIDEASVQLNSRSFKSNINPDFLNTLLTSRHYHMSIFYTSQKFNLTDKLLRDVTQTVIECHKLWRFQVQYVFDGTDLENAANPSLIQPIRRIGFFVTDKDYASYDTLAVVDQLKKSVDTNDFISEEEILKLREPKYFDKKDKKKLLSNNPKTA